MPLARLLLAFCLAAPVLDVRRAPPQGFTAVLRPLGRAWRYDMYELRYPSPVRTLFPANGTVWGTLYLPRRPQRGAVLLLPVLAAPNRWIEERFALSLVTEGYAVLELDLPYQFKRAPDPALSGQVFLARRPQVLARNFAQAVLDARRAVGWLRGSGLVDPRRIALVGVSLGALAGATTLSVDDRLAAGVLLLGGADFPSLIADGEMTKPFLRRTGLDASQLRRAFRGLDPLEYREANRGKRVLLVNVRHDLVIPLANALKLHEAFPDSRQTLLPLGHYTAMLHLLWMPAYVSWSLDALLPD